LHTGFVFGSDPESCDLLLDNPDKAAGVSGVHFRLQLDTERAEPDTIRIYNLSKHGTKVNGILILGMGCDTIRLHEPKSVQAGAVFLQIHMVPLPKVHLMQCLQYWRDFRSAVDNHPVLQTEFGALSMSRRSKETPSVHRGNWVESTVHWNSGEHYNIHSSVGSGTTGTVKLIQRSRDRALYAVKITTPEAFELGVNERKALLNLEHDHIVRVVDWAIHKAPEGPYQLLVLEYAALGNLYAYMTGERATLSLLTDVNHNVIMRQILSAQHIHSQGYAHGNIVPQNILVFETSPPIVKLADFSHSALLEDFESFSQGPFTAPKFRRAYIKRSSDQASIDASRHAHISKPADVYSAGVLLHFIVMGASVYYDDRGHELTSVQWQQQVLGPWRDNHRIDNDLKQLVLVMLGPAHERPTAAQCLKHAWLHDQAAAVDHTNQSDEYAYIMASLAPIQSSESLPSTDRCTLVSEPWPRRSFSELQPIFEANESPASISPSMMLGAQQQAPFEVRRNPPRKARPPRRIAKDGLV